MICFQVNMIDKFWCVFMFHSVDFIAMN